MSAYVVMIRESLSEPAEFDEYVSRARPARIGHQVTPAVGSGEIPPLEGDPVDGIVVNESPIVDEALAW